MMENADKLVGKFLAACKTPSLVHDIIPRVFPDGDMKLFYALKNHCLNKGLVSAEKTPESLFRYSLTERGRKDLEIYESFVAYVNAAEKSLSLVDFQRRNP